MSKQDGTRDCKVRGNIHLRQRLCGQVLGCASFAGREHERLDSISPRALTTGTAKVQINLSASDSTPNLVLNEKIETSSATFRFQDTFGRAKTWVKELQRQASPNIVIALAGNKADLANKRMVEYEVSQSGQETHRGCQERLCSDSQQQSFKGRTTVTH